VLLLLASLFASISESSKHSKKTDEFFAALHSTDYIALTLVVLGLAPIFVKAIGALGNGILDINCLMLLAVVGSCFLGQYQDAGLVVVLLRCASLLEDVVLARVRNTLATSTAVSTPRSAIRATGEEIDVKEIKIGDVLTVRTGEQVPVDGVLVNGSITVDESLLTGEAAPLVKNKKDEVLGGTLCTAGFADVRASSDFSSSALATISSIVEDSQATTTRVQLLLDRIVRVYTPVVVAAAVAVAVLGPIISHTPYRVWLSRSLVLLISACPCALTMAAPIPSLSAIANAARRGAIIKSVATLETLASLSAIGFDKTGTLTEGRFAVSDLFRCNPGSGVSTEVLLKWVAAVEAKSSHPLAASIVNHVLVCVADEVNAKGQDAGLPAVTNFSAVEGRGVSGNVAASKASSVRVEIGNKKVLDKGAHKSVKLEKFLKSRIGQTMLYVTVDGKFELVLALCDSLRPTAPAVVRKLHCLHVSSTMITGDSPEAAQVVQTKIQATEVLSSCKPADKVAWVAEKQAEGLTVGLIGDGINDSPALSVVDVGFAMGAGGSALAAKAAGVVFMNDDLEQVPQLLQFSRFVKSVIWQNVGLALIFKIFVMVLSIFGKAELWMAVVADVGSLLLVILNGTRALRYTFDSSEYEEVASPPHVPASPDEFLQVAMESQATIIGTLARSRQSSADYGSINQ